MSHEFILTDSDFNIKSHNILYKKILFIYFKLSL